MVGMLALLLASLLISRLEQQVVSVNHIIDDTALADLLALELRLAAQVAPVVVPEMVVRRDGERLDTGVDEELGKDGLDLGLPALQVVSADEGAVLFREGDAARNESVLGRTVDEGRTLEDSSDGEESRGRDLIVALVDSAKEVRRGVVDTGNDLGVALGVGRPEDDDAIESVLGLERADVRSEGLEVGLLVFAGDEVVGAFALVGGDEVGVVDGGGGA